jgi:hypothetical protein
MKKNILVFGLVMVLVGCQNGKNKEEVEIETQPVKIIKEENSAENLEIQKSREILGEKVENEKLENLSEETGERNRVEENIKEEKEEPASLEGLDNLKDIEQENIKDIDDELEAKLKAKLKAEEKKLSEVEAKFAIDESSIDEIDKYENYDFSAKFSEKSDFPLSSEFGEPNAEILEKAFKEEPFIVKMEKTPEELAGEKLYTYVEAVDNVEFVEDKMFVPEVEDVEYKVNEKDLYLMDEKLDLEPAMMEEPLEAVEFQAAPEYPALNEPDYDPTKN